MYHRALRIPLPPAQSAFLWGPRKIGKSTYLKTAFPHSLWYDLLDSDLRFALERRPASLRELIASAPVQQRNLPIIIDEVQKVPGLLDEIHFQIEALQRSFILCGSSARKLKRGQANMLGGRAWRFEMFPLVSAEVPDLDLFRALEHGLIPSHYDSANPDRALGSFVNDYLKEEVAAEALTRNLAAFARFLDLTGIMNAEMVNYAKIASEVGIDAKSVKGYFQILTDTLIGRYLEPLPEKPGSRKNLVATPKFYLFDPGLARTLRGVTLTDLRGPEVGHLFETFLFNEIIAAMAYAERRMPVHFWRTRAGAEVDFIVNGIDPRKNLPAVAIEAKISTHLRAPDLRSLNSFLDDYPGSRAIAVCLEPHARTLTAGTRTIEIMPWRTFCQKLWQGEILPTMAQPKAKSAGRVSATKR